MIYLSEFCFPDIGREERFADSISQTCYDTLYPFFVLSAHNITRLEFEPITILYGGNGSGKTTALNVIAEKLGLSRDALYNRSNFFDAYKDMCSYGTRAPVPTDSRIITSDDVFDFMLDVRSVNNGIDRRRAELFDEYLDAKYSSFRVRSLDDYDRLKKVCSARRDSKSEYVRKNLTANVREHSNGESAFIYFTQRMGDDGLFLLDEPENSLSPARQLELLKFLENQVRFFGCQIIVATHSPFLLSVKDARIYDFDDETARVKKWTELDAVRAYYDFFSLHKEEFKK